MTVDDLIEALQWAKTQDGVTGDTTVTVCQEGYDAGGVTITEWVDGSNLVHIDAQ